MSTLKIILSFPVLVLIFLTLSSCNDKESVRVCFWNIKDFGVSKSPATMNFIAGEVGSCDIVAVAEVSAGRNGEIAATRLNNELRKQHGNWKYAVSTATTGSAYTSERYAVFGDDDNIKKNGVAKLYSLYEHEINREPFIIPLSYYEVPINWGVGIDGVDKRRDFDNVG